MGNIITIQRPELTNEERERRMKQIKEAAAHLIAASDIAKGVHKK